MRTVKTVKVLLILLLLPVVFFPALFVHAEEIGDDGSPRIDLNQNILDKSYDHDCQLTVELVMEEDNRDIGYGNIELSLYKNDEQGHMEYVATIPWQKVDIDSSGTNSGSVAGAFYIPKGSYYFKFNAPRDPLASYTYFTWQKWLDAQEGKAYRIRALMGSKKWIEEHKKDKDPISKVYREMSDKLWDVTVVKAMEGYYSGKTESRAISTFPDGNLILIRDEYFRTWVEMTKEEQDDFLSSLVQVSEKYDYTEDFGAYCNKHNITILIPLGTYDAKAERLKESSEKMAALSETSVSKIPSIPDNEISTEKNTKFAILLGLLIVIVAAIPILIKILKNR